MTTSEQRSIAAGSPLLKLRSVTPREAEIEEDGLSTWALCPYCKTLNGIEGKGPQRCENSECDRIFVAVVPEPVEE